uniref:Minor tail protein n=1 Tax=Gordonia phage Petito TaxID=3158876 RepID=A0AAU8GQV9_9CAUD
MTFLQAVDVPFVVPYMGMNKTAGNQGGVGLSFNPVTNMIVDYMTEPDYVINGAIVIPYDFPSFQATIQGQIYYSGGSFPKVTCRIRRNAATLVTGSEVTTYPPAAAVASTTIMVNPGDTFDLYWQGEGSFFVRPSCVAGENTYLKVIPV